MFVHICINVLFLFFVKTNLSKISAIWARSPDPQSSATGIYTLALVLPTVLPRPASSQVYFSSATQSYLTLCDPRDCSIPGFCVHHQLLELAPTHVQRVSDAIQPSSSVVPFSSCLQSFPASGSFPTSQLFVSGSQSIRASASASVLQGLFPLGWTGYISLQSKGLSRVFSNTTVQKHQFFSVQLSLWSNSHIHT